MDLLTGQRIIQYETEDTSDNDMISIIFTTIDGDEFTIHGGSDGYVRIDAVIKER